MNQQQRTLLPQEDVDISGCLRCGYHEKSVVFLMMCKHANSSYKAGDKADFHTCSHMRSYSGACGPDKRLIKYV